MRLHDWATLAPLFFRSPGKLPLAHLWYMARRLRNENPHRHDGQLHINSFFPPYPSAPFDRFMEAAMQARRIPYSTYFAVTDECPFHCAHCSLGGRPAGRMSTAEAKDVIRQILSVGTITVGFTGGEPLMRGDIVELVACAGDNRQQPSLLGAATILFTTGHGLTTELACMLKDAGLDCIMIGLESAKAAAHDVTRGVEGSYREALAAVNTAKVAGLYTAISTIATREKFASGDIRALAELGARIGVHEFRILEPIPTGRMAGLAGQMLGSDDSRRLADFHIDWNRRGRGPAVAAFSYLESDEMFGCGAGYHHLFIDSLGNVCPCDLTPLSFGNVLKEPLEDIWTRMGEVFASPRCGCLMKDICRHDQSVSQAASLPLSPAQSVDLCKRCKLPTQPPAIYHRLLEKKTKVVHPAMNEPTPTGGISIRPRL
jgi:MoaA/NifB/PqqE/SkfB family radical SAM enzyme